MSCESFYLQPLGEYKETSGTGNKRRDKKLAEKAEKHLGKEIPEAQTDKIICAKSRVPEKCGSCGDRLMVGGPIWNAEIHNLDFVKRMYETAKSKQGEKYGTIGRIKGILGAIIDESILGDQPLSFDLNQVSSNIKAVTPSIKEI